MARVITFDVGDGSQIKIASLSWRQAEEYVEKSKELLADPAKVTPQMWLERTGGLVVDAMNRAVPAGDAGPMTLDLVKDAFDLPTIRAIADKVLEISGLKPTQGEAAAA